MKAYLVILKFTPFFIVAFILIYDLINVHYVNPEFSLTMAIIPAALIHVGLAVYFVRVESYIGMLLVLVNLPFITLCTLANTCDQLGHVALIVYLVSRIIVLNGSSQLANTLLKDEMIFLASVALAFSTIALAFGSACLANFQKGLKPIVLGQVQRKQRNNDFENDYNFQRLNHNVVAVPEESRRFMLD